MGETFPEQVERVKSMARGDATWDLSENDISALKSILTKLQEQGIQNRTLRAENEHLRVLAYPENL